MFINTKTILKIVYLNTNFKYCTINPCSTKWRCGDLFFYPKISECVPVSIITNTRRLSSFAQTNSQSGLI